MYSAHENLGSFKIIECSGFKIMVENERVQEVVEQALKHAVARNWHSSLTKDLMLLAEQTCPGKIDFYALDTTNVAPNAISDIFYHHNKPYEVRLSTIRPEKFIEYFVHETGHGTLELANPHLKNIRSSAQPFVEKLRHAICKDFHIHMINRKNYVHIQKKAAKLIFGLPQGYPRKEWTAERICFTFQALTVAEKAAKGIAPNYCEVLHEYIAWERQQNIRSISIIPKLTAGIKNSIIYPSQIRGPVPKNICNVSLKYPITHAFTSTEAMNPHPTPYYRTALKGFSKMQLSIVETQVNLTAMESVTMPWRPGFSEPRRVPFYKSIYYGRLAKITFQMAKFLILPSTVIHNTIGEMAEYPNQSNLTTGIVVTTHTALDFGAIAGLIKLGMSSTPAHAVVIGSNALSNMANEIRYIPPESMRNNRELFKASIFDMELSPEHEMRLLKEFDEGASWTRNYNENTAIAVQNIFLPFALLYDAKSMFIEAARSISDYFTAPNLPVPAPVLKPTKDIMTFHIPHNSDILSPDLNSFLYDDLSLMTSLELAEPNLEITEKFDLDLKTILNTQFKNSASFLTQAEAPFVSSISLAAVKNGLGINVKLSSGEKIGVSAARDGFQVSFEASAIGAEFFSSAMGATAGLGVLIGAGLLTVQYFYNNHLKRIQHKINKSIKHTNQDSDDIANTLSTLSTQVQQPQQISTADFITNITSVIDLISEKKEKEQNRGQYARSHHSRKIGDAHFEILRIYDNHIQNLSELISVLNLQDHQNKFIASNQEKNSIELIELVQELTRKTIFTHQDVSEIEGMRYIIVNKLFNLAVLGKRDEAQQLLKEISILEYYLPGEIAELDFGDGFGKKSEGFSTNLQKINQDVKNINTIISSGNDPLTLLKKLSCDITHYIRVWENEKSWRCDTKHKSSKYVSLEQWDVRIDELKNLQNIIIAAITQFTNGNQAANLELEKFTQLFQWLSDNSEKPTAFWMDRVKSIQAIPNEQKTETDKFELSLEVHWIYNDVLSHAIGGNFENANQILVDLGLESSEQKELTDLLAELAPLYNKNNIDLINNYSETIQPTNPESKIKNEMKASILQIWVVNNIFKKVSAGDGEEAISDLKHINQYDHKQSDLYEQLIQKIYHGEINKDRDTEFWLAEYKKAVLQEILLQTDKEQKKNIDPNELTVNIMNKAVASKALSIRANELIKLGFNKEAAEILETIATGLKPDLYMSNIISDLYFAHTGQILNIFTRPLQNILKRSVSNWNPSIIRSLVLTSMNLVSFAEIVVPNIVPFALQAAYIYGPSNRSVLELVNTAKIFVSNIIPRAMQAISMYSASDMSILELVNTAKIFMSNVVSSATHAAYRSDMSVVHRALDQIGCQLNRDLNPWHADYQNPLHSFHGITLYGHLLLQAVQLIPEWIFASEYLDSGKIIKNNLLSYGSLSLRAVSIVSACTQLKYAKNLKGGIFSLAYTPLHLATLANAGIDLGYYGYQQYKNSRGEAIEDPAHYRLKDGIDYGMTTLSMLAFSSMLSGGFAWLPLAAGFFYGADALDKLNAETSLQESTAKALIAAITNTQYYWNLQAKAEYLRNCRINIINKLSHEDIKKIKANTDIFIVRRVNSNHDVWYELHFLDIEKNTPTRAHYNGPYKKHWGTENDIMVLSDNQVKRIKFFTRKAIFSEPIVKKYTGVCSYSIINGYPNEEKRKRIIKGHEICFSKDSGEKKSSFTLFIKDNLTGYTKISLPDNVEFFSLLDEKNNVCIYYNQKNYAEISEFATEIIINHALTSSWNNIDRLLASTFQGLSYREGQLEPANIARIVHFHRQANIFFKDKDFNSLITLTNSYQYKNVTVISKTYQLPPHLAWQIILGARLLAYMQTEELLLAFREQYQQYTQYIYESAFKSKTWYKENWQTVHNNMKQILQVAISKIPS
jgi:hypothetical protein